MLLRYLQRRFINTTYARDVGKDAPVLGSDPQIVDYPNLPWENHQTREPEGHWDKQARADFGETPHEEDEVLNLWSPELHQDSAGKSFLDLAIGLSVVGLFAGSFAWFQKEAPYVTFFLM